MRRHTKNFALLLTAFVSALFSSCNKLDPPVAKFEFQLKDGGRVDFFNTSEGRVDEFIWDFGDEDSSFSVSPSHRYLTSGNFTVELIAINEAGEDRISKTVTIDIEDTNPVKAHPEFENADAVLFAYNDYTFEIIGGVVVQEARGDALAAFYDGSNNAVSVGRVTLNSKDLVTSRNNFYFGNFSDSTFLTGNMSWSAFGGNGFNTVLELNDKDFPSISPLVAPSELDLSTDTSLFLSTADPILLADSIMYAILDNQQEPLFKVLLSGNETSFTLDSMAVSGLQAGNAQIIVSAFTVNSKLVGGKRINIVNESRTSQPIAIVN